MSKIKKQKQNKTKPYLFISGVSYGTPALKCRTFVWRDCQDSLTKQHGYVLIHFPSSHSVWLPVGQHSVVLEYQGGFQTEVWLFSNVSTYFVKQIKLELLWLTMGATQLLPAKLFPCLAFFSFSAVSDSWLQNPKAPGNVIWKPLEYSKGTGSLEQGLGFSPMVRKGTEWTLTKHLTVRSYTYSFSFSLYGNLMK